MQSIVDCISSLFKVYKSGFLPTFQKSLQQLFTGMMAPASVSNDRATALCVFDDIIEHCSADGANDGYVGELCKALQKYSTDDNAEVRQAAVYGVGLVAQHVRAEIFDESMAQEAAQTMSMVLNEAYSRGTQDDDSASATDNAVSALGKLCKRSETIAQVALPKWLAMLPLRTDIQEARLVHQTLVEFVESSSSHLLGASHERLPQVICVLGQIYLTQLVEDALNPRIAYLLQQVSHGLPQVLINLFRDKSDPYFNGLKFEVQEIIKTAVEKALSPQS